MKRQKKKVRNSISTVRRVCTTRSGRDSTVQSAHRHLDTGHCEHRDDAADQLHTSGDMPAQGDTTSLNAPQRPGMQVLNAVATLRRRLIDDHHQRVLHNVHISGTFDNSQSCADCNSLVARYNHNATIAQATAVASLFRPHLLTTPQSARPSEYDRGKNNTCHVAYDNGVCT